MEQTSTVMRDTGHRQGARCAMSRDATHMRARSCLSPGGRFRLLPYSRLSLQGGTLRRDDSVFMWRDESHGVRMRRGPFRRALVALPVCLFSTPEQALKLWVSRVKCRSRSIEFRYPHVFPPVGDGKCLCIVSRVVWRAERRIGQAVVVRVSLEVPCLQ
jgi:hypothetical protein